MQLMSAICSFRKDAVKENATEWLLDTKGHPLDELAVDDTIWHENSGLEAT